MSFDNNNHKLLDVKMSNVMDDMLKIAENLEDLSYEICLTTWMSQVVNDAGLPTPFDIKTHTVSDMLWEALRLHRVDSVVASMHKRANGMDCFANIFVSVPTECLDALTQASLHAAIFIGVTELHRDKSVTTVAAVAKRLALGLGNALLNQSADDLPAQFFDFAFDVVTLSKAMLATDLIEMIFTRCAKRADRILSGYLLKHPWDVPILSKIATEELVKQNGPKSMMALVVCVLHSGVKPMQTQDDVVLALRTCMYAWIRSRGDEDSMACTALKFLQAALREQPEDRVFAALGFVHNQTLAMIACCHRMPSFIRKKAISIVEQRQVSFDDHFVNNDDVCAALSACRWSADTLPPPTLQRSVAKLCPFAATDWLPTTTTFANDVEDILFQSLTENHPMEEQWNTLQQRLCDDRFA